MSMQCAEEMAIEDYCIAMWQLVMPRCRTHSKRLQHCSIIIYRGNLLHHPHVPEPC